MTGTVIFFQNATRIRNIEATTTNIHSTLTEKLSTININNAETDMTKLEVCTIKKRNHYS